MAYDRQLESGSFLKFSRERLITFRELHFYVQQEQSGHIRQVLQSQARIQLEKLLLQYRPVVNPKNI